MQDTVKRNGEIYRIRIEQDLDAECPFDNDEGMGEFYSLYRFSKTRDKAIEIIESENPDCVILSCYSHGGEAWSVKGEGMQCQWDTAGVAGVWMPNTVLLDELKGLTGEKRRARCIEFARQAMDTYNQYCSGDVWGYVIEKQNHCDKCQHDEWEIIDSCWGFYGQDTCKEEAENSLEFIAPVKVTIKEA